MFYQFRADDATGAQIAPHEAMCDGARHPAKTVMPGPTHPLHERW
jgi:hypothetical protein